MVDVGVNDEIANGLVEMPPAQPAAVESVISDALLTPEQGRAIEFICEYFLDEEDHRPYVTLGGYAGTGKTVVIKKAVEVLKRANKYPAVTSFMGKAVSVLRKKGIPQAQTLCSFMYDLTGEEDGQPRFERRKRLENYNVINDESSQINQTNHDDLLSFFPKIAYVGDHGQLEPIGKDPKLMMNPDIRLEEIHRAADQNHIIQFTKELRTNNCWPPMRKMEGLEVSSELRFWNLLSQIDIAIVGFNNTRHKVNAVTRKLRGFTGDHPNEGELIICLRNRRDLGIFNGQHFIIDKVVGQSNNKGTYTMNLRNDLGQRWENIIIHQNQFGKDRLEEVDTMHDRCFFDYGYAITCHKSQGSEYPRVAVLEQISQSWNPVRWRYTAGSRASEQLFYCRG
jgi:exodeoxyribonuclease-5